MIDFYTRQERNRLRYYRFIIKIYKDILQNVNESNDILSYVNQIVEISQTFEFNKIIEEFTQRIITNIAIENARDWRAAVLKSHKPNEFYKYLVENTQGQIQSFLTASAIDNASQIKTLPALFAQRATEIIQEDTLKGLRAEEISQKIKSLYPEMTEAHAQLIARTETSKISSQLTQVRSQSVGLDWYIWETAEDRRVRHSHDIMQGVICNFNNPPNPEKLAGEKRDYGVYNAGRIFNCRCYPAPIVDFSDISFPAKVAYNGQIIKMNKQDFLAIAK